MDQHYYNKTFSLQDVITIPPIPAYAGLPRPGILFRISPTDIGYAYVYWNRHNHHWYLMQSGLGTALIHPPGMTGLYRARLYLGIELTGTPFIMVAPMGHPYPSLSPIMEKAKHEWYERQEPAEEYSFIAREERTEMPWFEQDVTQVMNQAFCSRYIDSPHHPVIVISIK